MAEYKAIRGHTIRTIAGDADPLITGDIWYNSTARKIRGAKIAAGAWASGGNMVTAHDEAGSLGTQTAAMQMGGRDPGTPQDSVDTETYDGSSWTESPDLSYSTYQNCGFGTTTAGLCCGGGPPNFDETAEYDGSSWTDVNDLNTGRMLIRGDGIQTAGLVCGGTGDPLGALCESYDGTNWTEVGDLNNGRNGTACCGTQTAAFAASGNSGPPGKADHFNNELWNGTAWTEVNNVNTARIKHGGCGTSTLGLIWGGLISPAPPERVGGETEEWDGTSWSEVADLSVDRRNPGAAEGSQSAALFGGGENAAGAKVATTEEWNKAVAASSFTSS